MIKPISLALAVIFALVGLTFLLMPEDVLAYFNQLSVHLRLPLAPVTTAGFYVALAGAYMYVVAVLAWLIYRQPTVPWFPLLLAHAKLASALLSLLLFFWQQPYLIFLANGLVDGLLGLAALFYYRILRGRSAACC